MTRRATLAAHLGGHVVGRDAELSRVSHALDPSGPVVTFIHGIAGVGKSTLLERFALEARQQGAHVVALDCRAAPPMPASFLAALSDRNATGVADAIAALPSDRPVVVVLDHYESWRLLDSWLRLEVATRLPDNVSLVVGVRGQPSPGWHALPDGSGPVAAIELDVLSREAAGELLRSADVTDADADRLYHLTHGLPLALQVAVAAGLRGVHDIARTTLPDVAATVSDAFLRAAEPRLRRAVEASSVTRRATATLLRAMEPQLTTDTLVDLTRLPFVRADIDGLAVHDAVRGSVAATLALADPDRYARYRQTAWQLLQRDLPDAADTDPWRAMADLLYLIDHPLVREAFFPTGDPQVTVEPAQRDDVDAIGEITARHLTPGRRSLLDRVLADHLDHARVARDDIGHVVAFSVVLDQLTLASTVATRDPLLGAVSRHLRADPVPVGHDALILYADLSRDAGEAASEPLAGLWLDLKRLYLARRDRLARVYGIRAELDLFLGVAAPLGFRPVGDPVDIDGVAQQLVVLDFGPGSIDGWLSRLAARQFGDDDAPRVDPDTRAVHIDGHAIVLSPLEFGVLARLQAAEGRPASRADLIRDVWGHGYLGGSNVVDATVRTLRGKLGDHAGLVETVRGVGYRYHTPDS